MLDVKMRQKHGHKCRCYENMFRTHRFAPGFALPMWTVGIVISRWYGYDWIVKDSLHAAGMGLNIHWKVNNNFSHYPTVSFNYAVETHN